MFIYSITAIVKKDVETEWIKWMKEVHIPNILHTGYFNNHKFYKLRIPTNSSNEVTYLVHYECETLEHYLSYVEKDASTLQAEVNAKFLGKVTSARMVIEAI